MHSTGRTVILALVTSVAIAMIALFFITRALPTDARQLPPAPYTIKAWDGYVAVFERDDTYPMQVFDTAVAALPPEQQTRIQQGVRVEREEELYLILEDYTD